MSVEEQLAQDAKNVLDNPVFKKAFGAVAEYLEGKAIGCNPDNKDEAQRVILSKQLLAHIKAELIRYIEDAEMEEIYKIHMKPLEKKGLFGTLIR